MKQVKLLIHRKMSQKAEVSLLEEEVIGPDKMFKINTGKMIITFVQRFKVHMKGLDITTFVRF